LTPVAVTAGVEHPLVSAARSTTPVSSEDANEGRAGVQHGRRRVHGMSGVTIEHLWKVYRIETRGKKEEGDGERQGALARLGGLSRIGLGSWFGKTTREVWALKDVSLDVERGTVLGVIGQNGAGKTTLLKTLARITLPTQGRAVMRGRVVSLLGLGQAFQADLSARDNIFLQAALYGIPRAEVERNFDKIIEFADLGEFVDSPVERYSSGMYLRLAFSVAISMRPDVILADEVLAVGDIEFQERCLQRVEQAGSEGVTVLFVSHDMRSILRLCDKVVRLERGRLVDAGDPEEVVARYETAIQAVAWKKGGGKASPYIDLLNLRLTTPDGQEMDAPRANEEFVVSATFRTRQPGLRVRPFVNLNCANVLVFRAKADGEVDAPEPSVFAVGARIPAHFLAERVYTIEFKVDVRQGDEHVHTFEMNNRLTFRVYPDPTSVEATENRLMNSKAVQPGVIAPRLEWALSGDRDGVHV
jgi:lipopolysaccharide transport system ATP-binding protein